MQINRCLEKIKLFFFGCMLKTDMKSNKSPISLENYIFIRRLTVRMDQFNVIAEVSCEVDMTFARDDEDIDLLLLFSSDAAVIANDLTSFIKKSNDQNCFNLVLMIHLTQGFSIEKSIEYAKKFLDEVLEKFENQCEVILKKYRERHGIIEYIKTIENLVRGNIIFDLYSGIYLKFFKHESEL